MNVNVPALLATAGFAILTIGIFGAIYLGAARSVRAGELDEGTTRVLRWALAGHVVIYALLAITAFLGW
jgi:hypothetical protein